MIPYQVSLLSISPIVIPEKLKPGCSRDKSLSEYVETTAVRHFHVGKLLE